MYVFMHITHTSSKFTALLTLGYSVSLLLARLLYKMMYTTNGSTVYCTYTNTLVRSLTLLLILDYQQMHYVQIVFQHCCLHICKRVNMYVIVLCRQCLYVSAYGATLSLDQLLLRIIIFNFRLVLHLIKCLNIASYNRTLNTRCGLTKILHLFHMKKIPFECLYRQLILFSKKQVDILVPKNQALKI